MRSLYHLLGAAILPLLAAAPAPSAAPAETSDRARLIVLADMGNEPDEEQQILHLLMCHNEFDLEGLIAVTGIHLQPANSDPYRRVVHPELFHRLIDGYEKIFPHLHRHASGWLTPYVLHVKVASGQPDYGMGGVGPGKATTGSELIIRQVTAKDPRPIHIVANAGSNTLAQALVDYRATHTPAEVDAFVAKLRVFENGAQDDAGAWITHTFPNIHWIRGKAQSKCYGGPTMKVAGPNTWKPYPYSGKGQDDWAHEHIRTWHGALGELYPMRLYGKLTFENPTFIEGGGTIPWMALVSRGLTDPSEQTWGGWSGRYTAERMPKIPADDPRVREQEKHYEPWTAYTDAVDRWVDPATGEAYHDANTAIWPWRQAMWNDFQARMDWCVKPFAEANHHPVAVLNGDATNAILRRTAKPGDILKFDASASTDPDRDALRFSWWIYPEAGRTPYGKPLPITNATASAISVNIPADAAGKELHLILEVWDQSKIVPLVDYRRVVITVSPPAR